MDTDEGTEARWRRRGPLYTWELTPLCEISDEMWAVIGPILFPEGKEGAERSDIYPWLYRLDEKRREEFIDYCVELDCWHEELEFAAGELETAMESTYTSEMFEEDAPHYRRLALIYHSDNVDHRIYAYREKVFQLVNLSLGVVSSSIKPDEFKRAVRNALRTAEHGRILRLLDTLEDPRRTKSVADALKRRRQLIHALAIRLPKSLQARRRIEEFVMEPSQVEAVQQLANLEALIKEGREEIELVCKTLAAFRVDLVQALKDAGRR
jgi:hypothetical protein